LAQKYERKAEAQEDALFRSGYLVKVPIALTNESRLKMNEVCCSLVKALPKDARGTYFWFDGSQAIIICRTQDVSVCKQVLRDY
jgi:hypothetical protein